MPENQYVEMICHLEDQPQIENSLLEGFEIQPLEDADEEELYQCYYFAFKAGEAHFFFDQTETERREFFDSLCLDAARNEPGSSVIRKNGDLVAFTFAIPYMEANRHISCMCVHPDHQRQGLGKFMLLHAMREIAAQGNKSITLGTDTGMSAFQLYSKHGFRVIAE